MGGKRVAIKRLRPMGSQAFGVEANMMHGCKHPNLLPLLGVRVDYGSPQCLISPLMRGGNLHGRLFTSPQLPPLSAAERLDVAILVARALVYLHGLSVVHCDVKSANILLDEEYGAPSTIHHVAPWG